MVHELHVYELDDVLYKATKPEGALSSWFYDVKSLEDFGFPGSDTRWNLEAIIQARRASQYPGTRVVVLTGRPDYPKMRHHIVSMLKNSGVDFDEVVCKPVTTSLPVSEFKAHWIRNEVVKWKAQRVVIADSSEGAVFEIRRMLEPLGVQLDEKRV